MPQDLNTSHPPSQNQSGNEHLRWRPDRSQLEFLKSHFRKTKYPTIQEKHVILEDLNKLSKSTINLSQLNNWFQKRRMKEFEDKEKRSTATRVYEKFSKSDLEYLQMAFEENMYPRLEEQVEIAQFLGVKFNKVQNWYKQTRRLKAKEGELSLQERRYFEKDQLDYIQEKFNSNCLPSKKELDEMAKELDCDVGQIRNWFANNRKKFKTEKQPHRSEHCSEDFAVKEPEVKTETGLDNLCKVEDNISSEFHVSFKDSLFKDSLVTSDHSSLAKQEDLSQSYYINNNSQYYTPNITPLQHPVQTSYYSMSYQIEAPVQINHQITMKTNNAIHAPYRSAQNNTLNPYILPHQMPHHMSSVPMNVVYVQVPYEVLYTHNREDPLKSSEPHSLFYGNHVNNQYFSNFHQTMPLM